MGINFDTSVGSLGTQNVFKSTLESLETTKICPGQTFKASESRNQCLNNQIARVDGKGGEGPPLPFGYQGVGDTGGSDKDYLNSLCSDEKA